MHYIYTHIPGATPVMMVEPEIQEEVKVSDTVTEIYSCFSVAAEEKLDIRKSIITISADGLTKTIENKKAFCKWADRKEASVVWYGVNEQGPADRPF